MLPPEEALDLLDTEIVSARLPWQVSTEWEELCVLFPFLLPAGFVLSFAVAKRRWVVGHILFTLVSEYIWIVCLSVSFLFVSIRAISVLLCLEQLSGRRSPIPSVEVSLHPQWVSFLLPEIRFNQLWYYIVEASLDVRESSHREDWYLSILSRSQMFD